MAHTFINISFEDPDSTAPVLAIDGEAFEPEGWAVVTVTNSVEVTADFGASAGAFTERAERFEAHWTGLATYVEAYADPVDAGELGFAVFNTGLDATAFDSFEREWSSNEDYLFGLGATGIAAFDPITGPQNFEDYEEEWSSNQDYAFDISGITTSPAAFDPITGPENFEDYEEEWSSNQSYSFTLPATTAAAFDSGGAPQSFEDYEETDLTQWLITVNSAIALGIYTLTIDGEEHTHVASGAPTVTTIRDGLVAAVAAGSKPVATTTPAAAQLALERDPAIQVPARNTSLALAVDGPSTGDVTKLPADRTADWTQTGQMAIDP